jgi:nicotinamide-nucleotide amidase
MKVEVVAIGTELLLGQIVDTNSSWIGEQLALAGLDSHFQTKVGDNLGRMVESLRLALGRSDAVICCGGLGPTQDDVTREAIAEVMGVELVRDPAVEARIRAMFEARGRAMAANNLRQADVPRGASTIPQQPGTAPGLICPVGDKVVYAVPGVPSEMREMVAGTVIADLQRRSGVRAAIVSRVLRTWGQSESGLAEMLAERIDELDLAGPSAPTLAFLASGIEGIKVRITAKAADTAGAQAVLAAEEGRLRAILGELVFGVDDETMESVVLDRCAASGLTLALAEGVTGGLMASRVSALDGAAGVLRGAVVVASPAARSAVLGLDDGAPVDEAVTVAMARAAQALFGAEVAVATTGATTSDRIEGVTPGTVCLGVAIGERTASSTVRLPGDRARVAQFATISAMDLLRRELARGR